MFKLVSGKSKRNIFVIFCCNFRKGKKKNVVQTHKKLFNVRGEEVLKMICVSIKIGSLNFTIIDEDIESFL